MTDAAVIRRFAVERNIAWYLLHPETAVAWPPEILGAPACECGGFRVYRLARLDHTKLFGSALASEDNSRVSHGQLRLLQGPC